MELKDIIKDYKYRHQLTNDEIAAQLGVTKSTVSRWISWRCQANSRRNFIPFKCSSWL